MSSKRLFQPATGITLLLFLLIGCRPPRTTPGPRTPTTTQWTLSPAATVTATPTVGRGGFPRRFHVVGNAFVDQYGQKMIFRGLAPIDPVLMALGGQSDIFGTWGEHHYRVMSEWGANIVRLEFVPNNLHTYGMSETLRVLDQTIAWLAENKMYAIIDFQSVGWPPDSYYHEDYDRTSPMEIMRFWDTISGRYADNDVVAFYELYSEPVTEAETQWYTTRDPNRAEDWLTWKGFMEQVIRVIRANDPDKIVLVGGLQYAFDLEFVADAPIADSNVAYTDHVYTYQWNIDWDTAFGNLCSKYPVHPVFATEIGYDDLHGPPDSNVNGVPYHQAIIDYLERHHISWTAGIFDATWTPVLLQDMQTYQPSASGEYFRSQLLELNYGVPAPETPSVSPDDMALNQPASASSSENPSQYPPEFAVDGDIHTRWSSAFSDSQWIQVDLGQLYSINRVVLAWESAYAKAYQIQTSRDGTNWETIYSTAAGDGSIDDLNVSGIGRYIRMYGTARVVINGSSYGFSLWEFEVYGSRP